MKKIILIALTILVVVAATISANGSQEYTPGSGSGYGGGNGQGQGLKDGSGRGAGNGTGGYGGGQGRNSSGSTYRENFVEELEEVYNIEPGSGVLSSSDEEGLALMREEEKLAHDVYLALYEKWNIPVFNNIAASEQQHTDAVKLIIDAYGLDDPADNSAAGTFENPELQKLYNDLVAQGSASLSEALKVGATIEDLDIADLQELLEKTENTELKILYQNLMKGSRNHLRSFTAQLERYNESYEPVYISKDYYDTILKYNHEMAPIADPDYKI